MSKVTGLGPVQRRIEKALGEISKKSAENNKRMAKRVLKRAQELVPVVTGELKESGETDGNVVRFTAKHAKPIHELPSSSGYKFLQRAADEITADEWADSLDDADFLGSLFG